MRLRSLLPLILGALALCFFSACATGGGVSVNKDRGSTETVMQMRQFQQR
jgi:hypothetical protein